MSFHNAPVAKGLMMLVGGSTFLCAMFDVKHYLHLQLEPHLSRDHQYWRLLLHQFACDSSSDLFIIEVLLFDLAVTLERRLGSMKFASLLSIQFALAASVNFLLLLAFQRYGLNKIPPGPFSLAFALLDQYYRIVPTIFNFRVFGITFSNNFQVYLLSLLLATARLPGSLSASFAGLIVGQLYHADQLGLKSYRLPLCVRHLGRSYLRPMIGRTPALRGSSRALPPSLDSSEEPSGPSNEPTGENEGVSIVQNLVTHLRGRGPALRNPARDEIEEVIRMFPSLARQTVTVTLQRSINTAAGIETLLSMMNESAAP